MSHEVHLTRGSGFGQPGSDPITLQQWTDALADRGSKVAETKSRRFVRLCGCFVVFRDGLIAAVSPNVEAWEALRALASTLDARMFAEDGLEHGLTTLQDVRRTVSSAFPDVDVSVLDERLAEQLAIVSENDSQVPTRVRERAWVTCSQLEGAEAKVGLSYLLSRAVESGGSPPATSTSVVAQLLKHDAARLESFRRAPTQEWVNEVEPLSDLVAKKPGAYVIRSCRQCGAKNRVALFAPPEQRPKCGRCKTLLPPLE